jgi:hypothetical protein
MRISQHAPQRDFRPDMTQNALKTAGSMKLQQPA